MAQVPARLPRRQLADRPAEEEKHPLGPARPVPRRRHPRIEESRSTDTCQCSWARPSSRNAHAAPVFLLLGAIAEPSNSRIATFAARWNAELRTRRRYRLMRHGAAAMREQEAFYPRRIARPHNQ